MNNYCGIRYIFNLFSKHPLVPPMRQALGYLYKDTNGIYTREQKKQKGGHECLPGLRPTPIFPCVLTEVYSGNRVAQALHHLLNWRGLSLVSLKEPSDLLRQGSKIHEGEPFLSNHEECVKEEHSLVNGAICAKGPMKN